MKAKINIAGRIEIERRGSFKDAECPHYRPYHVLRDCGDWCPLFIEDTDTQGDPLVFLCCAPQHVQHEVIADERVPALEPGKTEEGA